MNKNIVFLITDQQRYDTLTSRNCLTPNLDRLAESGTVFDNAFSVSPICSPARASLMTGKLPHNHGMVDNAHTVESFRASLIRDGRTFPEHLKSLGYSLGYFGKWHVDRQSDLGSFGFAEHENENEVPRHNRTIISRTSVSHPGYNERLLYGVHQETSDKTEEYYLYSKGIEFIEKQTDKDTPWCVFISTNAPHDPYVPPKDMYELYDGKDIPLPPSFTDALELRPNIYRRIQRTLASLDEAEFKEMTRCYYALCTLVDAQVGRVLDVLQKSGHIDDTVIVFMSDHGDLLGAHRLFCKGVPAFNEGYHIPLIIKDTRFRDVRRTSVRATTIDIFPTVLELAGCEPLTGIDGESLVNHVVSRIGSERLGYAEFFGQRFSVTQRIVWKDEWKYVFNGFDEDELYLLDEDPYELNNLAHDRKYALKLEELCRCMWKRAKETRDESFLESEYYMFRFAPIGPEKMQKPSIYNKDA